MLEAICTVFIGGVAALLVLLMAGILLLLIISALIDEISDAADLMRESARLARERKQRRTHD